MKGAIAIMLGLLALAAAIAYHGMTGRYELVAPNFRHLLRVDRLTGEVCMYKHGGTGSGARITTGWIEKCAREPGLPEPIEPRE